eukprot:CAMPEP_0181297048 /NCGR_PEP_ID=MMETSP1101-20121128/5028_1 /TAXON_ID=46948 /ORGANISM="Rhodomonas abbreviata, Strain Caron Lab Isolate" /LENGTH=209 /DNA_ID=CAMNT_0023401951 /DNA_START=43 /DNA_END=672 /DNA_ORIENTATION=+
MITGGLHRQSSSVSKVVHHNKKAGLDRDASFSLGTLQLFAGLCSVFLLSRSCFFLFGEYFGTKMLVPSYKEYGGEIDQNTRIMGGMWFFISFCMLWCIPRIDEQNRATLFRCCWGVLFFGGLGRLISVITVGSFSPTDDEFMMVLELILAPVLVYWHWNVECQCYAAYHTTPHATPTSPHVPTSPSIPPIPPMDLTKEQSAKEESKKES